MAAEKSEAVKPQHRNPSVPGIPDNPANWEMTREEIIDAYRDRIEYGRLTTDRSPNQLATY